MSQDRTDRMTGAEPVWQEYPRPQLQRRSYINLNGVWEYAIREDSKQPQTFDGDILVPFSPESRLSGVEKKLAPRQTLWYRRLFETPELDGGRLLLHFGAVDQSCRVYVNGLCVGEHVGGYLPFSFDITDCLTDRQNVLTVQVKDELNDPGFARGKQSNRSAGIWYHATSGIWQTVWMEVVPEVYITSLRIEPELDTGNVHVSLTTSKPYEEMRIGVSDRDGCLLYSVEVSGAYEVDLPLDGVRPWSPEDPYLYDLMIALDDDRVTSYFGVRQWSIERNADNIPCVMLNHKQFFFNGLLDQGYWQEGLYTAPSDDALVYDIATARELGFNTLRKHIKVEPARWYYHCDRLGMVVLQDMVNGGGGYNPYVIYLHNRIGSMADGPAQRGLLARKNPFGRLSYIEDLRRTVECLRAFPSIAMWVPFNEGWGQFESARAAELLRSLDPGRLIDAASGWFDQGAGDFISRHVYFKKFQMPAAPAKPVLLSEFGGYACAVGGHTAAEHTFGYRHFSGLSDLTESFSKLYCGEIIPAIRHGLCGCIYTQLSDVEQEINGIMTYDRKVIKLDVNTVKSISSRLTAE